MIDDPVVDPEEEVVVEPTEPPVEGDGEEEGDIGVGGEEDPTDEPTEPPIDSEEPVEDEPIVAILPIFAIGDVVMHEVDYQPVTGFQHRQKRTTIKIPRHGVVVSVSLQPVRKDSEGEPIFGYIYRVADGVTRQYNPAIVFEKFLRVGDKELLIPEEPEPPVVEEDPTDEPEEPPIDENEPTEEPVEPPTEEPTIAPPVEEPTEEPTETPPIEEEDTP